MDTARIAALLEPFLGCPAAPGVSDAGATLTPFQLEQISIYIDLLLRWNARINLTAIRQPEEIVTRHFGESLFLARHVLPLSSPHPERSSLPGKAKHPAESTDFFVSSSSPRVLPVAPHLRVIDIGSGAGFPPLPLKIWAPHIHLTLIESNHKKAAFLREVIRTLTLTEVNAIATRAEALLDRIRPAVSERQASALAAAPIPVPTPKSILQADIVTFRAVEKFESILPLAARFLAPSGRLALLVSSARLDEIGKLLGDFEWIHKHIPESHSRLLLQGQRISP